MISKKCNCCNANIICPKNHTKEQKYLNLDSSIHSFISKKQSNSISNLTSTTQIPYIVEGHTRLLAKLIHRIEYLEKRTDKK